MHVQGDKIGKMPSHQNVNHLQRISSCPPKNRKEKETLKKLYIFRFY